MGKVTASWVTEERGDLEREERMMSDLLLALQQAAGEQACLLVTLLLWHVDSCPAIKRQALRGGSKNGPHSLMEGRADARMPFGSKAASVTILA
jgi:hypothetical protein